MKDNHRLNMHEDVKDSILDAVGRLIERYGYKKMTVDDIAQEAGIGKGTLYLYFPSKEEIALSWFDRVHSKLVSNLQLIADSQLTQSEKIKNILSCKVLFIYDFVQKIILSIDELFDVIKPSLMKRRTCHLSDEAKILSDVLSKGCAENLFNIEDIDATSNAILLAISSLLPFSLRSLQLGDRDEIEKKVSLIADIMLHGLLSRN